MSTPVRWWRLDRHDEPTAPPEPPAPQPDPTPTGQPGQDPNQPVDVAALPANVQQLIANLRRENATHRQGKTTAEQAAQAAQQQRDAILRAAGLNPDGSPADDPEAAAAQLTAQLGEYHDSLWQATVDSTVRAAAVKLGADAEELLDSNAFLSTLDEHVEADPRDPAFVELLRAKVAEAVERNPAKYKAAAAGPGGPRPDPSQGRGGTNGPTDHRTSSQADFAAELGKYGLRPRTYT